MQHAGYTIPQEKIIDESHDYIPSIAMTQIIILNLARTCYTRGYSLVAFKQLYLVREREWHFLMYSLD